MEDILTNPGYNINLPKEIVNEMCDYLPTKYPTCSDNNLYDSGIQWKFIDNRARIDIGDNKNLETIDDGLTWLMSRVY